MDNTGQYILTSSLSIVDLQKVYRANLKLEQGSFLLLFAQYISNKLEPVLFSRTTVHSLGAASLQCYNSS
jgi:hypothetical protein